MARNELTQLLLIAEKLLALAESQAETDLDDTRARQKFRRETVQQLDRIEEKVERVKAAAASPLPTDAFLTTSEFKKLVIKAAPWVVSAVAAVFHVLRSVYHF